MDFGAMMKKKLFMAYIRFSKRMWIGSGVLACVILLGAVIFSRSASLPPQFLDARMRTADVGRKIVALTNATNEKINLIHSSDVSGDYTRANTLIEEARAMNREAYQTAFDLSQNLKTLAESLSLFSSSRDRQTAYSAIAVELGLVSEFITYTGNLNSFLGNLSDAIATDIPENRRAVEQSLGLVNQSVATINQLNKEFLSKMKVFDGTF